MCNADNDLLQRGRCLLDRSAVLLSILEEHFEREKKLGEILVDLGALSHGDLAKGLDLQKSEFAEKLLGDVLLEQELKDGIEKHRISLPDGSVLQRQTGSDPGTQSHRPPAGSWAVSKKTARKEGKVAPSNTGLLRNTVIGILLAFLVVLVSQVAFADPGIRLTIDYATGATIFLQDVTADTDPIEITTDTSPYTIPASQLVSGHKYSVWVTRNDNRMLVKSKPNDWEVDASGTVATGVWAGGTEPVHFSGADVDLSITKVCEPLIAGAQGVLAYTLTITYENGTEPTDTTVEDQIPTGLTNVTYTLDGVSQGGWPTASPYSVSLGSVTPGTTHIIRIYVDVDFALTSIAANTATVSSADDVIVTYNNTDTCTNTISTRGRIVIQKATNPPGDSSTFSFSGDLGAFNLAGDGASQSFIVEPGTYAVSESPSTGWILSSITGDNNGDPSDGVAITVAAGETKTVTFNNTKIGGYVTITPGSATNEVGQEHTFLITAYATGAVPSSWNLASHSVTPTPDSENLAGPVVASGGMSAAWSLTINNYEPGTFAATATVEIGFGTTTLTVSTDGSGGSSSPAEKTYRRHTLRRGSRSTHWKHTTGLVILTQLRLPSR